MSISIDDILRQGYPDLTSDQLDLLRPFGEQRLTRPGDIIFEAGDPHPFMVVVLSGRIEMVDRTDGADGKRSETGPGGFVGELSLLTGQTAFASCIVREPGEVLVLPPVAVQDVIATLPELGDLLVTAFSARRQMLMCFGGDSLTIIAPESSPALLPLAEFVGRNRIPNRWLAPDDPAAIALLERLGAPKLAEVWVVVRGQLALADPSPLKLAKALGLDLAVGQDRPADLLIVGTGPAGLSAAVYGASEGLATIAVDDVAIGGQAGASSRIENYLGFPTGIAGGDLAFRAEVQALKFGARISMPHRATKLSRVDGLYAIELDEYMTLRARSVIIATGARYRRLRLADQARFEGVGIYYAATELEARRCRHADVVVVGGGNSAGQAAMFLAGSTSNVHLLYRGPDLAQSMSQYLLARLERTPNVHLHVNTNVRKLHGADGLEAVTISHDQDAPQRIPAAAMFVMIGTDPCTDWLRGAIALDRSGFILTGPDLPLDGAATPLSPFQTSLPGVFAVGDVRSGSVKRVASAVGEGSVVVQAIHRYLAQLDAARN